MPSTSGRRRTTTTDQSLERERPPTSTAAIYENPAALAASLDDYETGLWNLGLDLEQICWYRLKSREYPGAEELHAEYPTTDVEAFANTGNGVTVGRAFHHNQ